MSEKIFAVVDLETTGVSYERDGRIIQIGCAFVKDNQIIDTFQSIVNPKQAIPAKITKLTGITNEQVKDAPTFDQIAGKVYGLLTNTVFVAHNVDFDYPYLNAELQRCGYPKLTNTAIDTVSLSQILFPQSTGYRLRDLTNYLHIKHESPHLASSDALATAHLLIKLRAKVTQLPIVTLEKIVDLSQDLPEQTRQFLIESLASSKEQVQPLAQNVNVIDGIALQKVPEITKTIHSDEATFPKGKAEKEHLYQDQLEWRKPQAALMNYIYQQFEDDYPANTVVEAPTGIGKTLGYLLPLSYLITQQQRPVVISVPTIVLQNQLINQAAAQLNSLRHEHFQFVLLKSRNHYLDLALFKHQIDNYQDLGLHARIMAMQILVWLTKTKTGDLDEINLTSSFSHFLDHVRQQSGKIYQAHKNLQAIDFYRRVLKRVENADFIITNHHYLINHAIDLNRVLKRPLLVIDEAQHLVNDLRNFNPVFLNLAHVRSQAKDMLNDLVQKKEYNMLLLADEFPIATFHIRRLSNAIDKMISEIELLQHNLRKQMWKENLFQLKQNEPIEMAINMKTFLDGNFSRLKTIITQLSNALIELDGLSKAIEKEKSLKNKLTWCEIKKKQPVLEDAFEKLPKLIEKSNEYNYWAIIGPNRDEHSIKIGRGIQDTGFYFQANIRPFFAKTLLIGGTLFVSQNRDRLLDEFGFSSANTDVKVFNSDFDFANKLDVEVLNSKIRIDNENNERYEKYLVDSIRKLLNNTIPKQTLILFNSLDTIRNVYNEICHDELFEHRRLLAQGITGSRNKIIREFDDEHNAVLMGASSFWEGVDFPGAKLELLIITRLPFKSPENRIFQAARLHDKNVFAEFLLPDALLNFKQGIGRVIRNSYDRGAVVILDNRIMTRKYGKQFLNQLPPEVESQSGDDFEIQERINFFFAKKKYK